MNNHILTQTNKKSIRKQIDPALGSFKSSIHSIYIKDQSTKELVENFMDKHPKYKQVVEDNIIRFFQLANGARLRKKKHQV